MSDDKQEATRKLLLAAFDKELDVHAALLFLLQNEDGSPRTEVEHILQVWRGINLLLDTRRLDNETSTMLINCEKSLTEQLILVNRETHDLVLSEKKRSNRPDAKAFVESYLLVGQDGMELYIRTKTQLEEIKSERRSDPTSEAHVVSAETIRRLEILVEDFEVSLRSGIVTNAAPRKPRSGFWQKLFNSR